MYINNASTISFQPTFEKKGFYSSIKPLGSESELIQPSYQGLIPPMDLRRMTNVIKLAVACAKSCVNGLSADDKIEGIVVGTGLGSIEHTEMFMQKVMKAGGGLIAPTSFMLSTHNTIAGQISLALKCNGYNNTHSQNSLSFEQSLLDALLLVDEGHSNVLVGSSDERNEKLFNFHLRLGEEKYLQTFGASFFRVDSKSEHQDGIQVLDVELEYKFKDFRFMVDTFLRRNNVSSKEVSRVYFSCYSKNREVELKEIFNEAEISPYEKYSGCYHTASSFATHLAYDFLMHEKEAKYAIVINNTISENLGITLLKKD